MYTPLHPTYIYIYIYIYIVKMGFTGVYIFFSFFFSFFLNYHNFSSENYRFYSREILQLIIHRRRIRDVTQTVPRTPFSQTLKRSEVEEYDSWAVWTIYFASTHITFRPSQTPLLSSKTGLTGEYVIFFIFAQ